MAKVLIQPDGCWIWTGAKTPSGDGTYRGNVFHQGKTVLTHRAMYEIKVGPIPEGLVLDHLCRTPLCCNPEHLEPVTNKINIYRGVAPTVVAHLAGTCTKGHSLIENACYRKGTKRVVYCKACRREQRDERKGLDPARS